MSLFCSAVKEFPQTGRLFWFGGYRFEVFKNKIQAAEAHPLLRLVHWVLHSDVAVHDFKVTLQVTNTFLVVSLL